MKLDADGSLTIYVQHDSPGEDKEANWLPAPDDEFFFVYPRLLAKPELLQEKLTPKVEKVN